MTPASDVICLQEEAHAHTYASTVSISHSNVTVNSLVIHISCQLGENRSSTPSSGNCTCDKKKILEMSHMATQIRGMEMEVCGAGGMKMLACCQSTIILSHVTQMHLAENEFIISTYYPYF